MTTPVRLLAQFNFLRYHTSRANAGGLFQANQKTIQNDRKHVIPILATFAMKNSSISWEPRLDYPETVCWRNANLVIDCSAHNRRRIHPGHAWWYRGDKHCCFMQSQMVVDLAGSRIASVGFVRGHNNDQGTFNMTGMARQIEQEMKFLIGDGGYHHGLVITQNDVRSSEVPTQQFLRGIVEIVYGLVALVLVFFFVAALHLFFAFSYHCTLNVGFCFQKRRVSSHPLHLTFPLIGDQKTTTTPFVSPYQTDHACKTSK
mmetsp:Transcript_29636/g.40928  ORF Transcript_29636/g.40928 Transcript_29636/m.40928 type:complete len:259 (+) Transcript_29636:447-1223(+)